MHCNKYYISLFHNLLLFNSLLTSCFTQEPEWIMDQFFLEDYITENVSQIAAETTRLCNLPQKTKVTICDYVFNKIRERNQHMMHLKYLNKTAFSLLNVDCVKNPVIFDRIQSYDFDVIIPQQYMMQCYGKYNPLRTSWIEDDAFDGIYIFSGIDSTSFIILEHDKTTYNFYHPFTLIEHLVPEKLPEVEINRNSLTEELISIESISLNTYRNEIEDMFVRETLIKSKLEKYDSICNLKTSNKILLCEKIMNSGRHYFNYWILDKSYFNYYTSQCVERTLTLASKSIHPDIITIKQMMYPCYGRHNRLGRREKLWYLSEGYLENSVLMYMEHSFAPWFRIVDLYENIRLENLLDFYY